MSVIVPVHQWDAHVERSLASILKSCGPNDEIIVVWDGTDAPHLGIDVECLSNLPATARVIKLATSGHQGPAVARNLGASAATREILVLVDSDVVLHDNTLELFRQFFAMDRGDAVFGCYDDQPAVSTFFSTFRNLQHHHTHASHAGRIETFWTGCGAVRRSAFLAVGGFDPAYKRPSIEDIELGGRLHAAGARIILDPNVRCTHLKHWRAWNTWKTDLFDRAIPWSRLILSRGRIPSTLNTDWRGRCSVALACLAWIPGLLPLLGFHPGWSALGIGCLAAAIALQGSFLGFLARRRGIGFALQSAAPIAVYLWISGAGFAWAVLACGFCRTSHTSNTGAATHLA